MNFIRTGQSLWSSIILHTLPKEKVYESASKLSTYIKTQISLLRNDNDNDNHNDNHNDSNDNSLSEDVIEIYNIQNKECALTKKLLTYW